MEHHRRQYGDMNGDPRLPARHANLPEWLAWQVLDLIRNQELDVGDRIPSVKDLAERFTVAAPTMREALSLLQMAGYLDIRHGSGIYVQSLEARLLLNNPYGSALDGGSILELLEARRLIEPQVAGLAARNATSEQMQELEFLLAGAAEHLSGGPEADAQLNIANMRFHRALADAAHNRVLAEVVHTLTEVRVKEQLAVLGLYDNRERDFGQHRDILAAVMARDEQSAADVMRLHLSEVHDVVAGRLRERS